MEYVLKNKKTGKYIGIDEHSGGYPYECDHLRSAKIWGDAIEAEQYKETVRKDYSLHKLAVTNGDQFLIIKTPFQRWLLENKGRQWYNDYAGTEPEKLATAFAEYEAIAFANWLSYYNYYDKNSTIEQLYEEFKKSL